jgi:hypothetical protein
MHRCHRCDPGSIPGRRGRRSHQRVAVRVLPGSKLWPTEAQPAFFGLIAATAAKMERRGNLRASNQSLYSSVAERQSCKLKVLGSIPSGGLLHLCLSRLESKDEGREIRTPNLLIWSQTRCRCAIPPMAETSVNPLGRRPGTSGPERLLPFLAPGAPKLMALGSCLHSKHAGPGKESCLEVATLGRPKPSCSLAAEAFLQPCWKLFQPCGDASVQYASPSLSGNPRARVSA